MACTGVPFATEGARSYKKEQKKKPKCRERPLRVIIVAARKNPNARHAKSFKRFPFPLVSSKVSYPPIKKLREIHTDLSSIQTPSKELRASAQPSRLAMHVRLFLYPLARCRSLGDPEVPILFLLATLGASAFAGS